MINIRRVKLFIVEITDCEDNNLENLFDYGRFVNNDVFIGIAVTSPTLLFNLGLITPNYKEYSIDTFNNFEIKYPLITELLTYIGFNLTTDEILDIMLDENIDINRRFYLESFLYYKSNQEGKKINKIKLKINHFDDFIYRFSEDIFSYDILSNNEDFSETVVTIETHLTEKEIKEKYVNFLI